MKIEQLQHYPMGENKLKFLTSGIYGAIEIYANGIDFDDDQILGQSHLNIDEGYYPYNISGVKPYLRSLSQLTETIIHIGYNDGKPFIPIEELEGVTDYNSNSNTPFKLDYLWVSIGDVPWSAIKQLLQWHFDISNTDKSDYIEKPLNS